MSSYIVLYSDIERTILWQKTHESNPWVTNELPRKNKHAVGFKEGQKSESRILNDWNNSDVLVNNYSSDIV